MIVATSVTYANSFSYLIDQSSGKSFPGLEFRVFVPGVGEASVDIKAYLDTGAEFCVYDGALIAPTLGIDLMAGREVRLSSAAGFQSWREFTGSGFRIRTSAASPSMPRSARSRFSATCWGAISFGISRSDFASSTRPSSSPPTTNTRSRALKSLPSVWFKVS
jgi:hypothetical protein